MADFDLTQTDAQVQSILNDGQNMQGAGAQTTLTTESVLLKDVNGNYHKILKSSFTEAIRDTLAGLLVNNDKGTTINQIAAIASGDFGSITPANLASVLGACKTVIKKRPVTTNTELFTFTITPSGTGSETYIPGTAIKINISEADWIDYFNIDLNFVDVNQQAVAYGFKDNIDGVIGSSNTFKNKFYLEQDTENTALFHVKLATHSSDPVNIVFREITAVRTTITYTMVSTTIGDGAVLLGQTTK